MPAPNDTSVMRVKSGNLDLIVCQLKFFSEHSRLSPAVVNSEFRPLDNTGQYTYVHVKGHHVRDWPNLWALMDKHVWYPMYHTTVGLTDYIASMHELAKKHGIKLRDEYFDDLLICGNLTRVEMTHGDLNFTNVIEGGDSEYGLTLIDPDNRRGLHYREFDEAKMLQSMSGFDQFYYNEDELEYTAFPMRRVHLLLLVTHFLRMLRYIENPFARRFIDEAINGHIGHRWCDLEAFRKRALGSTRL